MGKQRGHKAFRPQPQALRTFGVGICKQETVERYGKTLWRCANCREWRSGVAVDAPPAPPEPEAT